MNLYVKNLADDVDDDALIKEFEALGTVKSARVRPGRSRHVSR